MGGIKLKHEEKNEFIKFQAKIMLRFCGNALISVLIVISLYLFLWKQRLGDVVVNQLHNYLSIDYETAFMIYHEYFRGNKEIFFAAAIVLVFILLLMSLFRWMNKYFREINQGIDILLADDKLSKEPINLGFMLEQLSDELSPVLCQRSNRVIIHAIAKEIVLLHGGNIKASSEKDTVTFTVELPAAD